nr:hypothetical protein [Acidipila rosea]
MKVSLDRDRIKVFKQLWDNAILHQKSSSQLILHDDGRDKGDGIRVPSQKSKHRHVIHFGEGSVRDPVLLTQEIESCPDFAFQARQQNWIVAEVIWEYESSFASARLSNQAYRLSGNPMRLPWILSVTVDSTVRQNEIYAVNTQTSEKIRQRPGLKDHLNVVEP